MSDTFLPVVLCLISAVTVAATNMFVKRGGDVLTARIAVAIVMGLSVLPFAPFVPLPPVETWSLILVSVVVHWFYQFCLVRALHRGDLSLVFPVMRGLAPLVTAAAAVFVLGEYLTWVQSAGLFLASLAIIVFALPTGQTASARRLDRSALIWALLTALGVGLYAVADTRAARAMPDPMTFVVWLFLLDWIGVTVVTLSQRRGRIPGAGAAFPAAADLNSLIASSSGPAQAGSDGACTRARAATAAAKGVCGRDNMMIRTTIRVAPVRPPASAHTGSRLPAGWESPRPRPAVSTPIR